MKVLAVALLFVTVVSGQPASTDTKGRLDEEYGYVTVRFGAHMFWVMYHVDQPGDWTNYPLIMWLQGGPGASGVGYGNFEELGPYFINGTKRDHAWTKKANVMFVDNPVGTGYSYVENLNLLATTNQQIAEDLLALLKSVYKQIPDLSKVPFFVYAESYGGKMTVDFALLLDEAIKSGDIDCDLQGVALGDSWISPMDSVNTWAPFLYQLGFVNSFGRDAIASTAGKTQAAVDAGLWETATNLWSYTEGVIMQQTGGVNFYNVLAKEDVYRSKLPSHSKDLSYMKPEIRELYKRHVLGRHLRDSLDDLMNGDQADHWDIPSSVVWDGQGGYVFNTLAGDFMKPVIDSVVKLLTDTDIHVAVFTGNLDLICDTPGTYLWIENMEWSDKPWWDAASREELYISEYTSQAAYVQYNGQFSVFTLLRSGHMVPIDAPEMSLQMIDMITQFAADSKLGKSKHDSPATGKPLNIPEATPKKSNEATAKQEKVKGGSKTEQLVKPKPNADDKKTVKAKPKVVLADTKKTIKSPTKPE